MDEPAGTLPCDPGSVFYVPPAELSNETIVAKLKTIMDDGEAMNAISTDQAHYGLQLLKELDQRANEAGLSEETACVNVKTLLKPNEVENVMSIHETADGTQLVEEPKQQDNETGLTIVGTLPAEPGSILSDLPADLSKETIVAKLKTIMNDGEFMNVISTDQANYGLQLLKELDRRANEETASVNVKSLLKGNELENVMLTGETTYGIQLGGELQQQDNETGLTIAPADLSDKLIVSNAENMSKDEVENITSTDQVREKLMVANEETVSKDGEVESNISTDQATNGLQLVEELHQQDNETKLQEGGIVANVKAILNDDEAETQVQIGTLGDGKVLIVEEEKVAQVFQEQMREWEAQKHEKTKLKLMVNEKRTKIAVEVVALKAETDQKLKKIDEIVKQEKAIDAEITHMESQCSQSKCRHAMFIDLFKLIVNSGLPLGAHREIKLLIDKEDKAAQKLLSKAMEMETQIEARAKLKLTLQEERTEIAGQVEALKVQINQKLKEAGEVDKLKEALDSEITLIESQYRESELRCASSCLKRKTHDVQLLEELSPSETRAKRMNLNTTDTSQEHIHGGTMTNP